MFNIISNLNKICYLKKKKNTSLILVPSIKAAHKLILKLRLNITGFQNVGNFDKFVNFL